MEDKSEFITLSRLKSERSWTDASIKKFLGNPDKEVPNPRYRSAAPMKLYEIDRVIKTESQKDFIAWFEGTKTRRKVQSESQKKRMEKKRKELLDHINSLDIEVPSFSQGNLIRNACQHYNDLWVSRGRDDKVASSKSDKEFLYRISVNMLRHEFTHYEYEIDQLFGQVGRIEAYFELRGRILKKISEAYPYLRKACEDQISFEIYKPH